MDRNARDGSKPASSPPPTFLTSFPSFSPPDMTRSKRKSSGPNSGESASVADIGKKNGGRAVSTPTAGKKGSSNGNSGAGAGEANAPGVASSAVNRTVQAAVNLRRTIMDSITYRSASGPQQSSQRIFASGYEAAGDPLVDATDEHVTRIITSSGGPIATVKKYSADLAESNERVAAERNSKLKLVEESRQLRAELQDRDQDIEGLKEQLENARKLFERYVEKMQPGETPVVRFLDSPNGPYVLGEFDGRLC
jgi:hypothetical protein